MDRSRGRLPHQPGRYHGLQVLFAQDHGRALGPVVQHQVFEQVAKLWDPRCVYRVQCMWLPCLFLACFVLTWFFVDRCDLPRHVLVPDEAMG